MYNCYTQSFVTPYFFNFCTNLPFELHTYSLLNVCILFPAVITRLFFDPSGQYIVSSGGSDKFIRLWHNTPGMKEQLRDLKLQIASTSSEAMKVSSVL